VRAQGWLANELIRDVKLQTDLLDEIHRHVTAQTPQAGDFEPDPKRYPADRRGVGLPDEQG
jgi:hypothetical protein